jgi:hypothetical protein
MACPGIKQAKNLTSDNLTNTVWYDIAKTLVIFMNSAGFIEPQHVLDTSSSPSASDSGRVRVTTTANVKSDCVVTGDPDQMKGRVVFKAIKAIKNGDEILLGKYL